jgi:hypothetical protein
VIDVLLVFLGNPYRGAQEVELPGVPRKGDKVYATAPDDTWPRMYKVKEVVWNAELGEAEVKVK